VFSDLLRKILKEDLVSAISTLEQLIMQGRDLTQFVNDFTWYMRNLMLLKASDDMEDVLDVSTENLIQLREEAAMIRSDTLMRFLRIFSELANNIRYATNKRVLLELALIKLCRPEAEKDELSVLERVRRLERRMEQGYIPAGAAVQGTPGAGMSQIGVSSGEAGTGAAPGVPGGQPEGYAEPSMQYPKAAPEDLQKVRAMWKSIVGETSGMFRVVLSAAVPKFNASDANDNRLYVVFADFLAERYLTNEEKKQELQQIIAERTGRQVEVKFTLAADEDIQRGHLSSIEIEEIIHENIHMDIEYEE
jgi:DNA polymerase-3 subunit gamma/tau